MASLTCHEELPPAVGGDESAGKVLPGDGDVAHEDPVAVVVLVNLALKNGDEQGS